MGRIGPRESRNAGLLMGVLEPGSVKAIAFGTLGSYLCRVKGSEAVWNDGWDPSYGGETELLLGWPALAYGDLLGCSHIVGAAVAALLEPFHPPQWCTHHLL